MGCSSIQPEPVPQNPRWDRRSCARRRGRHDKHSIDQLVAPAFSIPVARSNSFGVSRSPADRGPSRSRRTFGGAIDMPGPRAGPTDLVRNSLTSFYLKPAGGTIRLERAELTGPRPGGTIGWPIMRDCPRNRESGDAACLRHFPGWTRTWSTRGGFTDSTTSLITYLEEQLQPRLPDTYYAQSGQRMWPERTRRHVKPNANVMREHQATHRGRSQGGVAVAEPNVRTELEAAQAVLITVEYYPPYEHIETFLEIRERQSGQDRLVATIEVLSRSNKTPSHQGFDQYRKKQRAVLSGQAHLIEIDLLRKGTHITAVPRRAAPRPAHSTITSRSTDSTGPRISSSTRSGWRSGCR